MRNDTPIPHGTANGYKHYKCRCDKCKSAMSEYGRKFTKKVPDKPIPHGTVNGYANYKCRCDKCKAAQSERNRQKYIPRPRREPNPIQHGTVNGYGTHKCRCDGCKAAQAEYMRRRYESDPENYVERTRRWREREGSREKMAEYSRQRAKDPIAQELRRDAQQRRRARKRGAFVEDVPRSEIFKRDNWHCQIPGCLYPGIPVKLVAERTDPLYANVDHIIPLSKGGRHERSNLATAHFRCNCVKNARIGGIA
jgi:5-methylcytosine-specific restriction endonuclease McrA